MSSLVNLIYLNIRNFPIDRAYQFLEIASKGRLEVSQRARSCSLHPILAFVRLKAIPLSQSDERRNPPFRIGAVVALPSDPKRVLNLYVRA
jgi:hypothetical protein